LVLLNQNLKDADQVEDLRAKAYCIAVDPSRREEAKQLVLDSEAKIPMTPEDDVMLGRIYLEDRQYQQALKYLTRAVRDTMPSIDHLALLAKVQLQLGYTANAATTVEHLKRLAPASWETVSSEARLLAAGGDKAAAARRLLDAAAGTTGAASGRIAALLEEFGRPDDAEKVLADDMARAKTPTAHVALVAFYVRTGKVEKAIALTKAHDGPDCPPGLTARLLSAAVYAGPRDPEGKTVMAEVTAIVEAKDKAKPNNVDVLTARAELADAAGKYDDAIDLYEKCIALQPDGYVCLNNAAVLLALHKAGAGSKPVDYADRVIKLRGPRAEFFDTRGLGYLSDRNFNKAIADFTLAAKLEPKAVYFFHLAVAHDQSNTPNPRLATAAMTEAERQGLTAETYKAKLHPIEWTDYLRLAK
jgi:tetratricopeptide (TPR) repeat protein